MTYQVLARRWRPRNFEEMVGQDHVLRALINALDNDRLHHAFLFSGTRGVGKTTVARILAKSLNCEQGVSSKPCGECPTCREIDAGRYVDLIEVDAASRTRVDETRELLDNVQYAPTRGRYKVYLIDEVHMFSNHSFNALLKTLEEPPPHVKFLLATTDPQKLPVTILSRCLQFSLRRLLPDQIEGQLARILEAEGVAHDAAALQLLARAADGSMRDGLSLLDQAIAFGGGEVREAEVRSMLGTIEQGHVHHLLGALADGDAAGLMAQVAELALAAPDFSNVLAEMITTLHHLALIKQVPEAWHAAMGERETLAALADRLAAEDIQLYYQIALNGRRDMALAPDQRSGFEMTLLRMLAFRPAGVPTAATPSSAPSPAPRAGAEKTGTRSAPPAAEAATSPASDPVPGIAEPLAPASPATAAGGTKDSEDNEQWHQLVASLPLGGVVRQLAMHCALESRADNDYRLVLEKVHAPLDTDERRRRIEAAIATLCGGTPRVSIRVGETSLESPAARQRRLENERQARAEAAISGDANVQALMQEFGAEIRPGSVQAIDETTEQNEPL